MFTARRAHPQIESKALFPKLLSPFSPAVQLLRSGFQGGNSDAADCCPIDSSRYFRRRVRLTERAVWVWELRLMITDAPFEDASALSAHLRRGGQDLF